MFEVLKDFFKYSAEKGLRFPFAFDPMLKKPSVTLLFAYIAFYLSVFSLIALHFQANLLAATGMSFVFTAMMIIFYLIRTINKAKIDLNDQEIELESGENDEKKSN